MYDNHFTNSFPSKEGVFFDINDSPMNQVLNQRGTYKDVLYTLTLRPSAKTTMHSREIYNFLHLLVELGGIVFIINGILVYLLKPLTHFALTIQSMKSFFFAKDSKMQLFKQEEEDRNKGEFKMPRIFQKSNVKDFT